MDSIFEAIASFVETHSVDGHQHLIEVISSGDTSIINYLIQKSIGLKPEQLTMVFTLSRLLILNRSNDNVQISSQILDLCFKLAQNEQHIVANAVLFFLETVAIETNYMEIIINVLINMIEQTKCPVYVVSLNNIISNSFLENNEYIVRPILKKAFDLIAIKEIQESIINLLATTFDLLEREEQQEIVKCMLLLTLQKSQGVLKFWNYNLTNIIDFQQNIVYNLIPILISQLSESSESLNKNETNDEVEAFEILEIMNKLLIDHYLSHSDVNEITIPILQIFKPAWDEDTLNIYKDVFFRLVENNISLCEQYFQSNISQINQHFLGIYITVLFKNDHFEMLPFIPEMISSQDEYLAALGFEASLYFYSSTQNQDFLMSVLPLAMSRSFIRESHDFIFNSALISEDSGFVVINFLISNNVILWDVFIELCKKYLKISSYFVKIESFLEKIINLNDNSNLCFSMEFIALIIRNPDFQMNELLFQQLCPFATEKYPDLLVSLSLYNPALLDGYFNYLLDAFPNIGISDFSNISFIIKRCQYIGHLTKLVKTLLMFFDELALNPSLAFTTLKILVSRHKQEMTCFIPLVCEHFLEYIDTIYIDMDVYEMKSIIDLLCSLADNFLDSIHYNIQFFLTNIISSINSFNDPDEKKYLLDYINMNCFLASALQSFVLNL